MRKHRRNASAPCQTPRRWPVLDATDCPGASRSLHVAVRLSVASAVGRVPSHILAGIPIPGMPGTALAAVGRVEGSVAFPFRHPLFLLVAAA